MGILREVADRLTGGELSRLSENASRQNDTIGLLQEGLADLELAQEDFGYRRLSGESNREFSRAALGNYFVTSRNFVLADPLIRQAVQVQARYVFGQGVTFTADDQAVQETIDDFLNDPKNKAGITSHKSRSAKEVYLQTFGNIFFVFFTDDSTGAVTVRNINTEEVYDIVTNPEDRKDIWFYRRQWSGQTFDLITGTYNYAVNVDYYPDWRYQPEGDRPQYIGAAKVHWESPVMHVAVGNLDDQLFGLPETFAANNWARAYRKRLEDGCSVASALSVFAWKGTTEGGAKAVAATKTRFGSTLGAGPDGTQGIERNPPPVKGSMVTLAKGTDLTPIKTAGAAPPMDEGRPLLLQVCAAMGIPEPFFGDASLGSYATSKTLDRPTELKFKERQSLWHDIFDQMIGFVIEQAIAKPNGKLAGRADIDRTVHINFPPILEHDTGALVTAIASAATLNLKDQQNVLDYETTTRKMCEALGIKDVDQVLKLVEEQRAQDEAMAAQQAASTAAVQPGEPKAPATRTKNERA